MWEEAIILGKELAEQYENEMFDFEQLSASLVSPNICFVFKQSHIDYKALVPNGQATATRLNARRLRLHLSTEETGPVLREHSEGHPAQTRLLRRGLLWHRVPHLPTREYSHEQTSLSTLHRADSAAWASHLSKQIIKKVQQGRRFLAPQTSLHAVDVSHV